MLEIIILFRKNEMVLFDTNCCRYLPMPFIWQEGSWLRANKSNVLLSRLYKHENVYPPLTYEYIDLDLCLCYIPTFQLLLSMIIIYVWE